jgi:two-component system response regulator YesN
MSSCYFSVIFKKAAGVTFINYLTGLRISKAKKLLLNSNKKSYEISFQVGYDNPTYFSTVFKKMTGLTPIDFKKIQRGEEE